MNKKMTISTIKKHLTLVLVMTFLSGCSAMSNGKWRSNSDVPEDLSKIENISEQTIQAKKQQQENKIRLDALRDTALSLGARSGLVWRTEQINKSLKGRVNYLDKVFNFQSLVMKDNVLPPVLVESRNSLNMATPHSIRLADSNYRIVKQARFITTPPTWRDYLITQVRQPDMPDPTLLPKNRQERSAWKEYTRIGWKKGVAQANQIYVENLNRLKRNYQGMIRYRTLLAQNMVSSPEVAKRNLGVTGGGEELSVNDRVLTIKALPALKADSRQWKPKIAE